MNTIKLKNLAQKNEVRIDNHKGHKYAPEYFYSSLREAFGFYFNTFQTKNASYNFYVGSTTTTVKKNLNILEGQFLDEENTVFCLVAFERFFELFLKDILAKANIKLTYTEFYRSKSASTSVMLDKIKLNTFKPAWSQDEKRINRTPFREAINRFYDMIEYSKDPAMKTNSIVKRFIKATANFGFLADPDYRSTLEFLNWYRDSLLHAGNKLPRMRFLDFIVTQRIIPIAIQILNSEPTIPADWLYFTKTITGIEILATMQGVEFELRNPKSNKAIHKTYKNLLWLGHLKELGRANMKMNNALRNNRSAYEYNYRDIFGRGERFALAEKCHHENATEIKKCPCCGINSMVYYLLPSEKNGNENIEWLKCYTCDYHIRHNVFDLHYFNPEYFEKNFRYAY